MAAACIADPYEAAAAVVGFWLYLLVMGNSPLGWVVAIFFHSVSPASWAAFLPWLVETFGSLRTGFTIIGCAAFTGTCVVPRALLCRTRPSPLDSPPTYRPDPVQLNPHPSHEQTPCPRAPDCRLLANRHSVPPWLAVY